MIMDFDSNNQTSPAQGSIPNAKFQMDKSVDVGNQFGLQGLAFNLRV